MTDGKIDLSVIGGGPAGYVAALRASRLGRKVVLFESARVGGTCLNVGCIPTKYLVEKGVVLERIRALTSEKIFDGGGKFSLVKILDGKQKLIEKLVSSVEGLLKNSKVEVVTGEAKMIAAGMVECGGVCYESSNILIATGSRSIFPPIPGLEGNVTDSTQALSISRVPKSMVVIGGGVIGLEFASIFNSFGSTVTVLEVLDEILPKEDRNAVHEVVHILTRRGIHILTGVKNLCISADTGNKKLTYERMGAAETIEADIVLAATGRRASLRGIDASALGIQLDSSGNIIVDREMRTNLPGVYAAGDVIGGWQLAHAAYKEAELAVYAMFGKSSSLKEQPVPRCLYTSPPMASVGITTQEAAKLGKDVSVGSFPYSSSGMALAEGSREGKAWVISDRKTGLILGVHIVGHNAPELIATGAMAIASGISAESWADMIVAHPTLSEIVHEAAMACTGNALHKPN